MTDEGERCLTTGAGFTFFDSPGSLCAKPLKIVLLEKSAEFRTIQVSLQKMEQNPSEYEVLNPNGVVPTLIHGERAFLEASLRDDCRNSVVRSVFQYQFLDGRLNALIRPVCRYWDLWARTHPTAPDYVRRLPSLS